MSDVIEVEFSDLKQGIEKIVAINKEVENCLSKAKNLAFNFEFDGMQKMKYPQINAMESELQNGISAIRRASNIVTSISYDMSIYLSKVIEEFYKADKEASEAIEKVDRIEKDIENDLAKIKKQEEEANKPAKKDPFDKLFDWIDGTNEPKTQRQQVLEAAFMGMSFANQEFAAEYSSDMETGMEGLASIDRIDEAFGYSEPMVKLEEVDGTRGNYSFDLFGSEVPCVSDYFNVENLEKIEDARFYNQPTFYQITTNEGNNVYVSTGNIRRSQFAGIVDNAKGRVSILSGMHGDIEGNLVHEFNGIKGQQLIAEDFEKWGNVSNVNIYNVSELSVEDVKSIIASSDHIVFGWCFSERSKLVLEVLGSKKGE